MFRMYNQPGYNATPLTPNGTRYGGHCFILIKCITDMLDIKDDAELKSISDWCIDHYQKYHWESGYQPWQRRDQFRFQSSQQRACQQGNAWPRIRGFMDDRDTRQSAGKTRPCSIYASPVSNGLSMSHGMLFMGEYSQSLSDVEKNVFDLHKSNLGPGGGSQTDSR